jgi:hypothetical protein
MFRGGPVRGGLGRGWLRSGCALAALMQDDAGPSGSALEARLAELNAKVAEMAGPAYKSARQRVRHILMRIRFCFATMCAEIVSWGWGARRSSSRSARCTSS